MGRVTGVGHIDAGKDSWCKLGRQCMFSLG